MEQHSPRILHYVRHGDYESRGETGEERLTPVGRRQARVTGARMSRRRISQIYSSDSPRSIQTAELMSDRMSGIPVTISPLLREVIPTAVPGSSISLETRSRGKRGLDAVIAQFFQNLPDPDETVVVCHGNLIRALVCHMLDAPRTMWTQLATHHCGVTTFLLQPGGQGRLVGYNDVGHLPTELISS